MSIVGDTVILDNGASGLFMCQEACHNDQQVSWARHGAHSPHLWAIASLPSEALSLALGLPAWHYWMTFAVIDDFGTLVVVEQSA